MFISEAFAQTAEMSNTVATTPMSEGMRVAFQLALIFIVLYFLFIRPQAKRMKQHQAELNAIIKGTKIVFGGIIGTVKDTRPNGELIVEVADGVEMTVLRSAVTGIFKEEKTEKK